MPVCWPSTQTSQTTVANIGKAITVLKCAIHTPRPRQQPRQRRPGAGGQVGQGHAQAQRGKDASACAVGSVTASPSEAPMKGAVQGEATATASTPVSSASTIGWRARAAATEDGSTEPNSNTPPGSARSA
jgi:hypothetical protein